jgi:hypothetical protein
LLFAFAALLPHVSGTAGEAAIHGLKLVALPVVAQGVLGMARQLCPDRARASIAALSAALILTFGHAWMQILVVALGAVAGLAVCRGVQPIAGSAPHPPYWTRLGWALLALFAVVLFGLPRDGVRRRARGAAAPAGDGGRSGPGSPPTTSSPVTARRKPFRVPCLRSRLTSARACPGAKAE